MKRIIALILCLITVCLISCKKSNSEQAHIYNCNTCKDTLWVNCCYVSRCYSCKGSGTEKKKCYNCDGRGYTTISDCSSCRNGYDSWGYKCTRCYGRGYVYNGCPRCTNGWYEAGDCNNCSGDGVLYDEKLNGVKCNICKWEYFFDDTGLSKKRCPNCNSIGSSELKSVEESCFETAFETEIEIEIAPNN